MYYLYNDQSITISLKGENNNETYFTIIKFYILY